MSKFKVGDKVRCMKSKEWRPLLTADKIYTVEANGGTGCIFVGTQSDGWDEDRFELYVPAPEHDPSFEIPLPSKGKFETRAAKIGALVDRKQQAYGDSVTRVEKIFQVLFPGGIKPEQYRDVLMMARSLDKFSRIATEPDAFGEDPRADLAGYALLWMKDDGK